MNIYIPYIFTYTTFTYISTSSIWLSGNPRFRSWWLVHVGALEVPKQLKLMWMMWSTRAILGSAWRKKQMVEPKFNAHAVYRYLYIYMSFDKKYAQQNIHLCQKLVASPLYLLYLETKSRCCDVNVNYGSCWCSFGEPSARALGWQPKHTDQTQLVWNA